MRILAVICSAGSLYYLVRCAGSVLGLIPLGGGFEGGVIIFISDGVLGIAASLLALLFAFIEFHRSGRARFLKPMLAWSCFLVVSFVVTFICG